jgi:hypothetical protein
MNYRSPKNDTSMVLLVVKIIPYKIGIYKYLKVDRRLGMVLVKY